MFRLRQVQDPQISPDGHTVAYIVQTVDRDADEYRSHIWLAPLDGGAPYQLTRGDHKDSSPRWSPNGRRLAFVSNRKEKRNEVWLIEERGEPWQLTETVKGATNPVWSPDGATVLYLTKTRVEGETKANEKRTPVEKNAPRVIRDIFFRFDGEGQFDDTFPHIWAIPAEGGDARQLTFGDYFDGEPTWSSDGTSIAFTSGREPDRGEHRLRDVWVMNAGGGGARKLTRSNGPSNTPVWAPDGRSIAYTGHQKREMFSSATTLVWTVPPDGGEPRALNEALDRSVFERPAGNSLVWAQSGDDLYFLANDTGSTRLFRVPANGGDGEALTPLGMRVIGFDLAPDGGSIVYTADSPTNPGELFLLSLDGQARPLTSHNAALTNEVQLHEAESVSFEGADGWQIPAWIVKPAGYREGERVPLVLDVHGGPHGMHGPSFGAGWSGFQELAGRGYAVLLVNPRGSSGYGEPFTAACVQDWGGKDYEDLMCGVDWAVAEGIADPQRLVVTGYSYGGFMTSWVVGHTDRFRAAVCGAPVANLISFYGESDIGTTFGAYEHGGPLWERWNAYRERSPLSYIQNCRTPFLLLHFEGDLRCPIGESEQLFAVLKKLGREVEFVRYPGGFHTYPTHAPSQAADRVQRTGDWFDRWLREGASAK
jgi:dipeptidyl aminopeptidase/acylaminoacyl peptidase